MNGKMRLFGTGSQILSQRDRFLRINKKIIGAPKLATDICSLMAVIPHRCRSPCEGSKLNIPKAESPCLRGRPPCAGRAWTFRTFRRVTKKMIQTNAFMKHNYACSTQMIWNSILYPKNIFSKLTMTLKFVECVRCLYKTCRVHVSIASIKSKSTKHGLKIY